MEYALQLSLIMDFFSCTAIILRLFCVSGALNFSLVTEFNTLETLKRVFSCVVGVVRFVFVTAGGGVALGEKKGGYVGLAVLKV